MDGVIVDSEKIYTDMNQKWFTELGFKLPIEVHQKYIGISAKIFWTFLKNEFKLKEPIEYYIQKEKELKFNTLSNLHLTPTNNLMNFISYIKSKKYKCALASSSLKMNINLILTKLNLLNHFDFVISGEEVTSGKPNPEIFLRVKDFFQANVNQCIVIEDSMNGVTAAKAADMFCIGYFNPNSGNQDLSKADLIIDDFNHPMLYTL